MDTVEKENELAKELEENGKIQQNGEEEIGTGVQVSKYENSQNIWFATNEEGERPVLFIPIMFIFLVSVMAICLYYFYWFQQYQEDLAAVITDHYMQKEREE